MISLCPLGLPCGYAPCDWVHAHVCSRRDEEEHGSQLSVQYLDELGKATEESEDTCHQLVNELKSRLVESPNSVHLLWRLARALVHLSMHCSQQGKGEEEKKLLMEGRTGGCVFL